MKKPIRRIEEISETEIQAIISSKPAVLIGSAISMFQPTNLSAGINFVESLFDFIFSDEIYKTNNIEWLKKSSLICLSKL